MAVLREITLCGICGRNLSEPDRAEVDRRSVCPWCGPSSGAFVGRIEAQIGPHGFVRFKVTRGGRGRPVLAGKWGDDFFRETGTWTSLRRMIDRESDLYFEHIEDLQGNVRRHVEEPLSHHRGHGSAKERELS